MTRQPYIHAAAVALLSGAIFCSAAYAAPPDQGTFSAMQGVKAQALSVDEMQAITGELNAIDIANFLYTYAGKLGAYPKLQASVFKLADYYYTNAASINQAFTNLHILTPCTTGGHYSC
jgi:hypothetical protein